MTAIPSNRVHLTPLLLPLILYLLPRLSQPLSPPTFSAPPPLPPSQRALLAGKLVDRLHTLANITETPPYTNRPYLSPASLFAQSQLLSWMRDAQLSATVDTAGNVIGDLRCSSNKRRLLMLGSHHDTVPRAGRFDGLLGVVSAISIAEALTPHICSLPFDIRVVAFDDEEGNNAFGSTNLGARAYTGSIDWENHLTDLQTFIDRYRGLHQVEDPIAAVDAARGEPPLAYLELHLEQGPVLEGAGEAVGAVDAIAGQTRMRVSMKGEAGHAGTVPMDMRRDALAASAEAVLAVERATEGVVATVGRLDVHPGAGNIVPGLVQFTVDVRSADDALRQTEVDNLTLQFARTGRSRGVNVLTTVVHDVPAVRMTNWITEAWRDADVRKLVTSGAGHDAQIMAQVCDVGMLFVRCRDGVSHREDEFVATKDVQLAVEALYNGVLAVARRVAAGV